MRVDDAAGVLPGVEDVPDEFGDAETVPDLGEEERPNAPHALGVAGHDVEVGSDGGGEVGLVDDEEVALMMKAYAPILGNMLWVGIQWRGLVAFWDHLDRSNPRLLLGWSQA